LWFQFEGGKREGKEREMDGYEEGSEESILFDQLVRGIEIYLQLRESIESSPIEREEEEEEEELSAKEQAEELVSEIRRENENKIVETKTILLFAIQQIERETKEMKELWGSFRRQLESIQEESQNFQMENEKEQNEKENDFKRRAIPNRRRLSAANRKILKEWSWNHLDHPYPGEHEKLSLSSQTSLDRRQIEDWFVNFRRRELEKMRNGKMKGLSFEETIKNQKFL